MVGVFVLDGAAISEAAQWTFTPGVELAGTYIDNVALLPGDFEEEDYVYEVNPVLGFSGEGERANVDFLGRMQNIFYQKDTSDDDTFYQLDGGAGAELVRENLFVDARVTRSQTNITSDGIIPPSNLVVTDNRTNITTISAGPRFVGRLGRYGSFETAYRFDRALYGDGGAESSDTTQHKIRGSINSGERFREVTWRVSYEGRRFERDSDSDHDTYQLANLGLDYRLTARLTLTGALGYEDNDIRGSRDRGNGTTWDVGFRWAPDARTTLGASYGKRFYGNTKSFFFSRFTRRVSWQATYTEEVTNNAGVESSSPVFDEEGNPVTDLTRPGVSDEVFVSKRGDANVQLNTGRSALGLGGYYVDRNYQSGRRDERFYGGSAFWTWNFGDRTRSIVSGNLTRRDFQDQANELTFWSTTVGLIHDINRSVFASVYYYHADQESDEDLNEYNVNAVQLRLTALFGGREARSGIGARGGGQSVQRGALGGRP
jgi:hypothetical protein